jgi:hypothetical protein
MAESVSFLLRNAPNDQLTHGIVLFVLLFVYLSRKHCKAKDRASFVFYF